MGELPPEVRALRERLARIERLADPAAVAKADREAAIVATATARGFRNPDLARQLLGASEGEPSAVVDALAAAEPYLVAPTMNDLIRKAARARQHQRDPRLFGKREPEPSEGGAWASKTCFRGSNVVAIGATRPVREALGSSGGWPISTTIYLTGRHLTD